jgi:hypothetical protein
MPRFPGIDAGSRRSSAVTGASQESNQGLGDAQLLLALSGNQTRVCTTLPREKCSNLRICVFLLQEGPGGGINTDVFLFAILKDAGGTLP